MKFKKEDKNILQAITSLKVNSMGLKRIVRKKLNRKSYRNNEWTLEELTILKENWGNLSIIEISNILKRSINSIKVMAFRIGLKDYFIYSEEITLNDLHNRIYQRALDTWTLELWKKHNLPYLKTIKCKSYEYYTIKPLEFLNWLEKNKRVVNLSLCKEGFLDIEEPEWLKEKRQADIRAAAYGPRNRQWTFEEDKKLQELVDSQKYGYRDISILLKRTEGALKRRMVDLKMSQRPIKADNHNFWKKEEIKLVKDLWLKGYRSVIIAEYVNRSALAINSLLERNNYFEDPPLKFQKKGEQQ